MTKFKIFMFIIDKAGPDETKYTGLHKKINKNIEI